MLSRFHLALAVRHIRRGGIVAYPTEGVYGLGCNPFDRAAVQRLFALKCRPAGKGLILIASDFSQVEPLLVAKDPLMHNRLIATWPGPVTWIVPAAPRVPSWLRGADNSLAVRVTDHPIAAALCRAFGGPLTSTSANPSDRPAARTTLALHKYFSHRDVLIVSGSVGGLAGPTPIYHAVNGRRLR